MFKKAMSIAAIVGALVFGLGVDVPEASAAPHRSHIHSHSIHRPVHRPRPHIREHQHEHRPVRHHDGHRRYRR